jgi:hypothetical protein
MSSYYGATQQTAMPFIQQQIPTFHGRQSAEMVRMAPNSSVIGVDDTGPIVWFCVTDSVGRLTVSPYDISPHKDPAPIDPTTIEARFGRIETQIGEIGSMIKNLEAKFNEQSNVGTTCSTAKHTTAANADEPSKS